MPLYHVKEKQQNYTVDKNGKLCSATDKTIALQY